ncbi:MAG: phospholipid carrier-dependent glycosyltransferase, partial [Tepidisphaeraceae bacterium]
MLPTSDQLRLLWAAALVALPLAAGFRFARRLQPPLPAISDAILIGYLIQYVSVGVAGALGFLSPFFLTLIALPICAALWISAGYMVPPSKDSPPLPQHRPWVLGICLFAFGFLAALIYFHRMYPPSATDALTYHLPAAVLWLQKKRIVLFQAWFFNPANTYSPLAGSMFDLWLLAPIGNDALARFAQAGPWIMIFFAVTNLARSAGAALPAAALVGLATVLSRPFVAESVLAMDDLFVAAFFLTAVAALSPDRCSARFGALRVGIALGLMLSVKYTAMLTLPILLVAADAPFHARWAWRQWCIVATCVALMAGPWYVRNLVCFGNPLFPMKLNILGAKLPGLFSSVRVQSFQTPDGGWQILTGEHFGLPPVLFVFLCLVWLAALVRLGRSLLHDSLRRLVLLGPPVGIATYVLLTPQAEVRFLFPIFGLMFAAIAIVFAGGRAVAIAAVAVTIATCTSFAPGNADQILALSICGIAVGLVGLLVRLLENDYLRLRWPVLSGTCIAVMLLYLSAHWSRYLGEYRDARFAAWQAVYPSHAVMWSFLDNDVPQTATIAYSNQFMIYPMYGFEFHRPVIYAPVRAGASVANLAFPERILDSEFFIRSMDAANVPADPAAWKRNLRAAAAQY